MAFSESKRRREIRDEIKKTSRDEFILKEMKRLGFWPDGEGIPEVAETYIKRRGVLQREIHELSKKHSQFEHREALLNKHRKERMRKSREQRAINKKRREDERLVRKAAWKKRQAQDIIYLGKGFSANLKNKENDLEKLARNKLPIIQDMSLLAKTLNTSVSELRFLSYHRAVTKISHYQRYQIPKKSGGLRHISAPKPRLKLVQRAILDEILSRVKISDFAHGFAKGKSIVTNARPHVGADIVINMDLKDFFPTLNYRRVWGMYSKLGFSDQIATVLSLICTEPQEEKIKTDGDIYFVNSTTRALPQGSPTSPVITNIICRRLDQRMAGLAHKLGFTYTRYADDMSFSGPELTRANIQKLLWQTKAVIKDEDFVLHPNKTRIMTKGGQQAVTGVVVNTKLSVDRKTLKAFRALLFQIEKDGPQGKTWGESGDLFASILGFARYVNMVDPDKGKAYIQRVERLRKKYVPRKKKSIRKIKNTEKGTQQTASKPWWKFW